MGLLIKWIIGIAIIYYLLKNFVFPIFKFSMFTNNRMQQMQDKMKEMEKKMNQDTPSKNRKNKDGDYIDYEEVK